MTRHDKLFIPGPVEVSEKTWAAFSRPLIGHRSEDFRNLYREIHPKLQTLFDTKQPVFLSTSSAWGVMEASIRNVVDRGLLARLDELAAGFLGDLDPGSRSRRVIASDN